MDPDGPLLIALGGNALILPGEKGYIGEQFSHTDACMKPVAALITGGVSVVITHGNGPIVGNILLRNECAKAYIPPMPLYICVADSQGGIGTMMAQSLTKELRNAGSDKLVSVVITHVVVESHDPAFKEPAKPIGPYYGDDEAQAQREQGWTMHMIPGRGWRRVVPSPKPHAIVEIEAIRTLREKGIIPIASGGGGIPVISANGGYKAVDAVIDKDLSAGILAHELSSKRFVILSDVDGVYLNWDNKNRRKLDLLDSEEARRNLQEGHFAPGSMGPKIEAAIDFLERGGQEVIIAEPRQLIEALEGRAGTTIIPA